MFSGIITDIGKILNIDKNLPDWKIIIGTKFNINKISIGDSICCDGICLTVINKYEKCFFVEVSSETRKVSNIDVWCEGYEINLEKSLKLGDLLNGHLVQGHIDCYSEILEISNEGDSHIIKVNLPKKIYKFITYKGSVAIHGVSLTVNKVEEKYFCVNIIPHTWKNTNLCHLKKGSIVNLEVDLIARYLVSILDKIKK
ncbi:riboflavin synthase [Candidatus Aquarickettsia rohweri]|uniref:Riboflavin synthase n=1 Tax=Candidatus Aquarickettsia rohweri TaxID=2602574 RepID=A0A429XN00_9RICK|nr:riboflavin synthase [Candidatus Aquarickettsia rohweri]RST67787.1 riboflavin synthase [Candidatus Aquarickettsia rohweri]